MKRPKIRASGGGGTWYIQGTIDSELSKIILMSVGAYMQISYFENSLFTEQSRVKFVYQG